MASEITYAQVRFKTNSCPAGPQAVPPPPPPPPQATTQPSKPGISKLLLISLVTLFLLLAITFFVLFIIFFQKYYQLLEGNAKDLPYTELECTKSPSSVGGKAWSCCPQKWHSFRSHCYFVSDDGSNSWEESEKACVQMQAHLMVINSKEEQDFITQHLNRQFSYFLGLWDPRRQNDWKWVDGTVYNHSATFWRTGEPSNPEEACAVINSALGYHTWAWNDIGCSLPQKSICEGSAIYL